MQEINEDYFKSGLENPINSPEDLLRKGEKILWKGRPKKSSFMLGKVLKSLPIVLVWLIIDVAFIYAIVSLSFGNLGFVIVFFGFHLFPVWMFIINTIKNAKIIKNIVYFITNKRILIINKQQLNIVNSVNIDKISDVRLVKGKVNKILKVGDIYITTNETNLIINDIPNSEYIWKKLQELLDNNKDKKVFYKDMLICSHCGSYFELGKKKCPFCGAPVK